MRAVVPSDWCFRKIILGIFEVCLIKHSPRAAKRAMKGPILSLSQASVKAFIDAMVFPPPHWEDRQPELQWLTDWVFCL